MRWAEVECIVDVFARLTWENLPVTVTGGKGGAQKVLQGLAGDPDRAHGAVGVREVDAPRRAIESARHQCFPLRQDSSQRAQDYVAFWDCSEHLFSSSASAYSVSLGVEAALFSFPCCYNFVLCFLNVLKRI